MDNTSHSPRKPRMYPLRTFGIIVGSCSLTLFVRLLLLLAASQRGIDEIYNLRNILSILLTAHVISLLVVGPVILTIYNILYLVLPHSCETMRKRSQWMEPVTIIFGGICFFLFYIFVVFRIFERD